ncbi:hypothetical protein K8Q94_00355 [Candidatus Nomurabacteria bacterium]|nr:hypothetical protein [Candidatus Nomurabacteria bacterium]
MPNKIIQTEIDKILGELAFYNEPELLKEEYRKFLKVGKNFNKEKSKKYSQSLASINWFIKKVAKYKIYFSEFYPCSTDNIQKHEALEHHIHAYLEDIITVKTKTTNYIGELKNDLKQVVENKKEISNSLDWLKEQIYKTFEGISTQRDQHRHRGFKFVDGDITNAEMAHIMLGKDSLFKGHFTDYAIEKFKAQKEESFEKAKKSWLENTLKNYDQIEGLANEMVKRTKPFLYQYLDIEPLDTLYQSH